MATSTTVANGDLATAAQYNDLRTDVLSTHDHDGTDGNSALQAASVTPASGNLTLSTVASGDVLIGDDATLIYVDGGLNSGGGGIGLGSAAVTDTFLSLDNTTFTGAAGANLIGMSVNPRITEAGSGTHSRVIGTEFTSTFTGGAATTTESATVRIVGAPSIGTTNYALWSDAGTNRFDGDIDLNSTGTLLNVGAAGNDWTASQILLESSNNGGTNEIKARNTSDTASSDANLEIAVAGTSGGDPFIHFAIGGAGQEIAMGLDNSDAGDRFAISDSSVLGTNDRVLLVVATGVMSVDGDGGGSDDPVSLFDDYDDALELHRFTHAYPSAAIPVEQRRANRERMVEMGISEWAPQEEGADHLMIRIQPMLRLLAGGVYQNRAFITSVEERLANIETDLREALNAGNI